MGYILEFVTSISGVTAACLLIIGWAAWAARRFRSRIMPCSAELRCSCELLEESQNDLDFAAKFEEFDARLRQSPLLSHQWTEFSKALIFPDINDADQVLHTTRSVDAIFSLETLLGQRINLRLYSVLPNLLTGAGILGTFVGLVAGIKLAGGNLANPDLAHEALSNLLEGASLAFLTSISGLISSILFSWREKHRIHEFEKYRKRWVEGLDNRLRTITLEKINQDNLVETRRQSGIMAGFTEQLAFQLTEALERTVPKALDEKVTIPLAQSLERLQAAVEEMARNQVRNSEEMLREVVENFTQAIQGAAGQEMQEFAQSIAAMNTQMQAQVLALGTRQEEFDRQSRSSAENLAKIFADNAQVMNDQLQAQLDEIAKQQEEANQQSQQSARNLAEIFHEGAEMLRRQVAESVSEIVDGLSGSVREMAELLDTMSARMAAQLDRTADAFAKTADGLNESVSEVRTILDGSRNLMDGLQQLVADTHQAHLELVELGQSMNETGGIIQATAAETSRSSEMIKEAVASLAESLNNLAAMQDRVTQTWDDYQKRFAETDQSLATVFAQINDGMRNFAEEANKFMTELDRHTSDITGKLAGAVSEFDDTISELAETLQGHGK